MDVWDGLSRARTVPGATRASAGLDHEEVIKQIQETQRAVNISNPTQIEANRLAIIVNAADIGTNVTNIGTNVTNIGTNTTDIGTNVTNIGTNTTDIGTNVTNIGTNTTDIGTNVTNIGTNTTDIGINVTNIGTNTTDISNLTIVVGTNTSNIGTNATNISNLTTQVGLNTDSIVTQLTNSDSVTIVKCSPVYADSGFKRARANSSTTTKVIGLASEDTTATNVGGVQAIGVLTATTGEWDAVTGDSGGLTPNTLYYLSETTAGKLKTTAPTTGYISPIGVAITTTQLRIEILNTVLL